MHVHDRLRITRTKAAVKCHRGLGRQRRQSVLSPVIRNHQSAVQIILGQVVYRIDRKLCFVDVYVARGPGTVLTLRQRRDGLLQRSDKCGSWWWRK